MRALTLTKKNEYGDDKAEDKGKKQNQTAKNKQKSPLGRHSGFTTAFEQQHKDDPLNNDLMGATEPHSASSPIHRRSPKRA